MASLVKSDPRYDYRIVEVTAERCELVFYEHGQETGRSTFTIAEARAAGVGSAQPPGKPATMLQMFPRNMLFSRAMSNGLRWYCPNASAGTSLYTPEEMGADVDGDGAIIEMPAATVGTTPAPTPTPSDDTKSNDVHWIDTTYKANGQDKPTSARFWAWATGDGENSRALTKEQVYTALKVKSIHDYAGDMGQAKADIDQWIAKQAELAEAVDELYPESAEA